MATYWETAPLPTWLAWYAHQLPMWAQRLSGALTFAVELGVPLLIWDPRRLRPLAFAAMAAFQIVILATANYGFFNYLSLALCLWVLDDGHLAWLGARVGVTLRPAAPRAPQAVATSALTVATALLVALSLVPFLPVVPDRVRRDPDVLAPLWARDPFPEGAAAPGARGGLPLSLHRRRDARAHPRMVDARAGGRHATRAIGAGGGPG